MRTGSRWQVAVGCEMSIRREGSMVQVQFDARLDEEAAEHALTVRPSFQRAFGLDPTRKVDMQSVPWDAGMNAHIYAQSYGFPYV